MVSYLFNLGHPSETNLRQLSGSLLTRHHPRSNSVMFGQFPKNRIPLAVNDRVFQELQVLKFLLKSATVSTISSSLERFSHKSTNSLVQIHFENSFMSYFPWKFSFFKCFQTVFSNCFLFILHLFIYLLSNVSSWDWILKLK